MSNALDLELKRAFIELQVKMIETSQKIQVIDTQISVLKRVLRLVRATQHEIFTLPPKTKTYEAVGRMFIHSSMDDVQKCLNMRVSQLADRTTELEDSKQYLEKNLKESEANIREMVQQRKDQIENSS